MTSDRQIAANRLNAEKCTENRDELGELITDLNNDFHPFGAVERGLLLTMIKAEWLKRRCANATVAIRNRPLACDDDASLREALIRQKEALARIRRCLNSAARDFDKAFNSLTALQAKRSFCGPFEPRSTRNRASSTHGNRPNGIARWI